MVPPDRDRHSPCSGRRPWPDHFFHDLQRGIIEEDHHSRRKIKKSRRCHETRGLTGRLPADIADKGAQAVFSPSPCISFSQNPCEAV
jgi:hypothetical protein